MLDNKTSKKAMSIAVVFLVLATLVLTIFSLAVFLARANTLSKTIELASLDDVYVKEELINFYINELMKKAVKDFKLEDGKQKFIDNFKQELGKYKEGNDFVLEELWQIEEQLKDENIEIDKENKKVLLSLSINVLDSSSYKDDELLSASYTYERTFEKQIEGG